MSQNAPCRHLLPKLASAHADRDAIFEIRDCDRHGRVLTGRHIAGYHCCADCAENPANSGAKL